MNSSGVNLIPALSTYLVCGFFSCAACKLEMQATRRPNWHMRRSDATTLLSESHFCSDCGNRSWESKPGRWWSAASANGQIMIPLGKLERVLKRQKKEIVEKLCNSKQTLDQDKFRIYERKKSVTILLEYNLLKLPQSLPSSIICWIWNFNSFNHQNLTARRVEN